LISIVSFLSNQFTDGTILLDVKLYVADELLTGGELDGLLGSSLELEYVFVCYDGGFGGGEGEEGDYEGDAAGEGVLFKREIG
jgi:hypothetical protein